MPGLDNTIPQSDSSADNDPEMNMPGGHDAGGDREGAMAKADLFKLANYSHKLYQQLQDEDQLEAWVQAKITKAADYIASVYHYLAYEMKFTEYAHHLDNSDTLSEGQKQVLTARLTEAKMKMKEIKKAQADKMKKDDKLDESMVDVCGHCGGAGHVEKKIPEEVRNKVDKYNRLVKATKAAHKRMDANHNGIPDDEELDELTAEYPGGSTNFSTGEVKGSYTPTKESFDEKSKIGDTKKTRTGELTKTSTGVTHKNTSYHDDGEAEQKSGKGTKTHAKAQSAAEKKDRAPALKQSPKSAKTWGMKDSEKFDNRDKMDEAKKADKDYDQDGKIESGKDEYLGSKIRAAKKAGKLKEGTCSVCKKDPCVCKKEKKCNECGMYESKCGCSVMESDRTMSRAAKGNEKYGKDGMKALAKAGREGKSLEPVKAKYNKYDESAKWRDPKHKDKLYTQEPRDEDDYYQSDDDYYNPKPDDYPGAKNLKGGGEYDHNDPLRKGYGRYGTGSLNTHGKRKGLPSRDHITSLKGSIKDAHGKHPQPNLPEGAKPSAGLSKAKKSAVVKDAKAGKDIGKPGKGFDKLAKKAGGGEKGEKIAAAAMWKNIKETTAYIAEKKKKEKMADEGNAFSGALEKAREHGDTKMTVDGKSVPVKPGKSISESTDMDRLRELTGRLNRTEQPALVENREVDQIRALTKRLLG